MYALSLLFYRLQYRVYRVRPFRKDSMSHVRHLNFLVNDEDRFLMIHHRGLCMIKHGFTIPEPSRVQVHLGHNLLASDSSSAVRSCPQARQEPITYSFNLPQLVHSVSFGTDM